MMILLLFFYRVVEVFKLCRRNKSLLHAPVEKAIRQIGCQALFFKDSGLADSANKVDLLLVLGGRPGRLVAQIALLYSRVCC